MKYSVGQKVKIRSLEWYQDNVNRYGIIECGKYEFFEPMNEYCGKVVTIKRIDDDNYRIDADKGAFCWTDEMIEGLAEEEVGLVDVFSSRWVNEFNLPDGYIFKDENGNVINATKIVLEKKKKEYPKTYEECCEVLGHVTIDEVRGYKATLLDNLQMLLVCRDAYWKIAGEEMGLGKLWKPSKDKIVYSFYRHSNKIETDFFSGESVTFEFPTKEMRDAFYENFKDLIEKCKELL